MKISTEETSPREVVLKVELESADIEPFLDRSYKRVVNRVQIPGFRRGKAPRYIVENYVGRGALIQESLDAMVQETLVRAIREQNLETFGEPDMELVEVDPPSFKAVVPLEPIVDLGDFRSLRLEPEPVEVINEQVDRVIELIRHDTAHWEPSDGPVQFGDLVTLNVDGTIEGKRVADDKGVEFIPTQDNPIPFPGFSIYLEGMKKDGAKEFTLTVPEDSADKSLVGKECRFHVKVLEIKKKELMALDDEFAKGVGNGYENLEALRTGILKDLTEQAERVAQHAFQSRSLDEVVKGASVQVSQLTVNREIDHLLEERLQTRQGRRIDVDAYLQDVGKTQEELREELRPAAMERLTRFLVLRKLAREEGIEVTPEEIDAEIDSLSSRAINVRETVQQAMSSERARSSLSNAILARKVLERLACIVGGKTELKPANSEASEGQETPETGPEDKGGNPSDH